MHLYSALLNVFGDSNKDLTWCTQMLHLSQKTMSLPSSLSGERHTSQMTSSSYSIPNPSSVSMAWFMLSWHCLSSASITRSIVSSSTGPSPECTIQNVLYPLKHIMRPNPINGRISSRLPMIPSSALSCCSQYRSISSRSYLHIASASSLMLT